MPSIAPAADKTVAPAAASKGEPAIFSGLSVIGLAIALVSAPFLSKKFKGMSAGEIIATVLETVSHGIGALIALLARLIKLFNNNKSIHLSDK